MAVNHRRSYHSPARDQQADATRRRILETAARLFARDGYPGTGMAAIAREAKVSVASLYQHFAGKAAIVRAMVEATSAAPELSVEHVERAPDPVAALRLGAGIMRAFNERSWVAADVLRSARGTDESLAAIWDEWQARHEDAMRRAVAALEASAALRPGLSAQEAIDTVATLTGTDVYRLLVRERGWTPAHYEAWLFRQACAELLGVLPGDEPSS